MYCPKCGKENPEGARFCMHCGADLSGYKVEISPKIEVSPKISVSAKAESGMTLKWKLKSEKFAEIEGLEWKLNGKLPVYEENDLAELGGKHFCPFCGNYDCLKKFRNREGEGINKVIELEGEEKEVYAIFNIYDCLACDKSFFGWIDEEDVLTEFERNFEFKDEKIPAYKNMIFCNIYHAKNIGLSSMPSLSFWEEKDGKKYPVYNNHSYPRVAFCPLCKRNAAYIKPVRTDSLEKKYYQGDDEDGFPIYESITYCTNVVKGGWDECLYSLCECKNCGKFLVTHGCKLKEGNVPPSLKQEWSTHIAFWIPKAYPMCEFCDNAIGHYACSVCGKRICKNCAVKEVVKKRRLLPDKTVKLCPNCAKEV